MSARSFGWRRVGRHVVGGILVLLLAFSGLLWYITTASFQQMVRRRLIASMERATGGCVELGSFHVRPLRLEVEVRDLTIHGREPSTDKPYVHVDSMTAVVKISSALLTKLAFHSLTLRRPVIHIIFYPDGGTNQPAQSQEKISDAERLLPISIDRLRVEGGELFWQDQQIPLDFRSEDVSARLNYSLLHGRYWGELAVGRAETTWDGYRSLAWAAHANFAVDRKGVEIHSLVANAGSSRLAMKGVLLNPSSLRLKASYDLELNLRDLAAIARRAELKSGTVELKGDASWSPQDFLFAGGFRLRQLEWQDKRFSLPDLAADGRFSLDSRGLSLTKVEGQLLRGSFSAQAQVENWQRAKSDRGHANESGIFKIKTRDLALAELLAHLGPSFHPLNKLRFSGNLAATSELRWKDSPRYGRLSSEVEVSPPAQPASGLVPIAGSVQLSYDLRSGGLEIAALSLRTPSSQVRAAGSVSPTGSLKVSFSSANMSEWQPVQALIFPEGAPFTIYGRASFEGASSGAPPNVRIRGHVAADDLDLILPISKRTERWHGDAVRADLDASRTGLVLSNASFSRGDARVMLNGSVELVDWKHLAASPFNLQVNVQNADASELGRLMGYEGKLSGTLSAVFSASGSSSRPQARGTVHMAEGSLEGVTFDLASAGFAFTGTQVSLTDFDLKRRQAEIRGGGSYDLSSQAFHFDLQGANFDVAEIAPLERSRITINGKLDFSAHGSGTTSSPDLVADLDLRNLAFNQETVGDLKLTAVSHGADLRLTGQSAFRTAALSIGGQVRLRAAWPAHIDFHFDRLDVDPLIEGYLRGHLTGHSTVSGDLVLVGPLRNPQGLSLTGTLTELAAQVEKIQLHNRGPIRFSVTDQRFELDDFNVFGPNADFSAHGTVDLAREHRLDLEGKGKVGLKLLESYSPDFTSSGEVTGEARVTGTVSEPRVSGSFAVQNGAIADINVPTALSEINGRFQFSQNRVTIEELHAKSGGGNLTLAGYAELNGPRLNFDLQANAESVRLRYPPGVSSTADAKLRWSGSSSASLISGEITVTKLGFTPGFDFGAYLEHTAQVAALPQTDPVLNRIRLDLHVVTTPELQAQTSVIRLEGQADLRIRGSAAKPVLLGRADVFEGEAYFEGTKYRLERGGVTFNNPAVTTPFLDVEATTHVRDYDITLSLSGEIGNGKQPRLNYRSEPPLPPADIISLLAFGQTSEESAQLQGQSQSVFSQQASSAMLAAALNSTLNNRAQRLFGNSRIKIDPQGLETYTSSSTPSGPAVTIEQQVKDNLTMSYTTNVSQTSQQVIRAEYNVSRNLSIVAIRDQNGVVLFDVKIRRRKR